MFIPRINRRNFVAGGILGTVPTLLAGTEVPKEAMRLEPERSPLKAISIAKLSKIHLLNENLKTGAQRKFILAFEIISSLGLPEGLASFECHVRSLTRVFGNYKNEKLTGNYYIVRFLHDFSHPYKEALEIWSFVGSHP